MVVPAMLTDVRSSASNIPPPYPARLPLISESVTSILPPFSRIPPPPPVANELLFETGVVQKVVGLARAARSQSGVRTRQPLSRILLRAPDDASLAALESHQDQVLEELNVKSVEFIARGPARESLPECAFQLAFAGTSRHPQQALQLVSSW